MAQNNWKGERTCNCRFAISKTFLTLDFFFFFFNRYSSAETNPTGFANNLKSLLRLDTEQLKKISMDVCLQILEKNVIAYSATHSFNSLL